MRKIRRLAGTSKSRSSQQDELSPRRRGSRPALEIVVRGWARHLDLVLDARARRKNRRECAQLLAGEPLQRNRFEFPRQFLRLVAILSTRVPKGSWAPSSESGGSEFGDAIRWDSRAWRSLEAEAHDVGGDALAAPIARDRADALQNIVTRLSRKPIHPLAWRTLYPALVHHAQRRALPPTAYLQLLVEAALHVLDPGRLVRLPPGKLRSVIAQQVTEALPGAERTRLRNAGAYRAPLPRGQRLDDVPAAEMHTAVQTVADDMRIAAEAMRRSLAMWDEMERVAKPGRERTRLERLRLALLPDRCDRCLTVAQAKKFVASREGVGVGAIDKYFSELRMRAAR